MNEHRQKVLSFFNKTNNYLHKKFGIRIRKKIIKDILGNIDNKIILDVGCGTGDISLQFSEKNNITLIDMSENMLLLAKKNANLKKNKQIQFYKTSFEEFAPSQKYDTILVIGLLAHVESLNGTIEKLSDCLKKGGNLIIQFSDYDKILTKISIWLSKKKYHKNKINYSSIIKTTSEKKMVLNRKIRYSILPPGIGLLPNSILYYFTKKTYENKFLSKFGNEIILELRKI